MRRNRKPEMLPLFAFPPSMPASSYATDGRCHNAEPGSFNHECGRPAMWIGRTGGGFESGFCEDCRERGAEAKRMVEWRQARLI